MDHSLKPIHSHEIPDLIARASLHGGKIAQPTLHSHLETKIEQINIDDSGAMRIKLSEKIPLSREYPISVRLNYRRVYFHLDSTQYSLEGDILTGHLPKAARAIAVRDNERYALPLNSVISAQLYRIEKRGGSCDINAHLIDISRQGLGLVIPQSEEELILKNDHIWLKQLNNIILPEAVFGRVVYAMDRKFKDGFMETKVGISLESDIPSDIFEEIKLMSNLKLRV